MLDLIAHRKESGLHPKDLNLKKPKCDKRPLKLVQQGKDKI